MTSHIYSEERVNLIGAFGDGAFDRYPAPWDVHRLGHWLGSLWLQGRLFPVVQRADGTYHAVLEVRAGGAAHVDEWSVPCRWIIEPLDVWIAQVLVDLVDHADGIARQARARMLK